MTSDLTRPSSNGALATPVPNLSPEEWNVLKNSVCKGFTDTEAQVFAFRCQAMGLSPLSGQISAFKQGGGLIPIILIDGYRSIAASIDPGYVVEIEYLSGNQWIDYIPDEAAGQARAKVWRTGCERPVVKAVSRKEFAGNSGPWRSMPNHMLAKVAESHGLRMAFPQALANSYTADEMANRKPIEDVQATEITPPEPPKIAPAKKKTAATATEAQLQTLATAMNRVLSDIGREAFVINIQQGFGITTLNQLPAEQFDVVMRTLGDAKRIALWNDGKDGNGNLVIEASRLEELQALAAVDAAEDEAYLDDPEEPAK